MFFLLQDDDSDWMKRTRTKKPDRLKFKKKIGAKFVFRKKLFSADQKFVQNHILGFFFHLTAWNFNFFFGIIFMMHNSVKWIDKLDFVEL